MTNSEYESACIGAATAPCKTEGQRKLDFLDREIANLEATMVNLLHARREIMNKYELNKCNHEFEAIINMAGLRYDSVCRKCGAHR